MDFRFLSDLNYFFRPIIYDQNGYYVSPHGKVYKSTQANRSVLSRYSFLRIFYDEPA